MAADIDTALARKQIEEGTELDQLAQALGLETYDAARVDAILAKLEGEEEWVAEVEEQRPAPAEPEQGAE